MGAYRDNREFLSEELRRLDLRLRLQVIRFRRAHPQPKGAFFPGVPAGFQGLVLPDEEIDRLLAERTGAFAFSDSSDPAVLQDALGKMDARIPERRNAGLEQGADLRLPRLSYLFRLTPFEEQVLLICLAPELDRKYASVYAYLQNDVTQKRPSIDFVCALLCGSFKERLAARRVFSSEGALPKYGLLRPGSGERESSGSLLSCALTPDARIVDFVLGLDALDEAAGAFARLVYPQVRWEQVQAPEVLKQQVGAVAHWYFRQGEERRGGEKLIFFFSGGYGAGKRVVAEALCGELGLPLVVADVGALLACGLPFEEGIRRVFREGLLRPAAVYLEGFERVAEAEHHRLYVQALTRAFQEFSVLTFLDSETAWEPVGELNAHFWMAVAFGTPDYALREGWWETALSADGLPVSDGVDAGDLANKFGFNGGQITDAVLKARNLALWRSAGGQIEVADLYAACRAVSNRNLDRLAQKVSAGYTWDDMVLPADQKAQLREMCRSVQHRPLVYGRWGFERKLSLGKGVSALFSGPSGTGKTMAAEVMANELHLDLYKVDLSQVVSKYIGETEKNLSRIFTEAQTSNAILFFDEADALFGKRSEVKDAHDRYANIEIGYLLQRMEEYEGITILATNLRKNMDDAFVRRLRFCVEFPFPDREDRRRIWEVVFPSEAPRGEDLDFDYLARQFKITGGNIKNIVLCAAFLAAEDGAICMRHVLRAVKREFQKMGRLCTAGEFGQYYHLLDGDT